jgi:superfamily II DNA or RNA helicase
MLLVLNTNQTVSFAGTQFSKAYRAKIDYRQDNLGYIVYGGKIIDDAASSASQQKIYFIELNGLKDSHNFSEFKKEYAGARFVINSIIPKDTIIYLPENLKCYIIEQDSDFKDANIKRRSPVAGEKFIFIKPYIQNKPQPLNVSSSLNMSSLPKSTTLLSSSLKSLGPLPSPLSSSSSNLPRPVTTYRPLVSPSSSVRTSSLPSPKTPFSFSSANLPSFLFSDTRKILNEKSAQQAIVAQKQELRALAQKQEALDRLKSLNAEISPKMPQKSQSILNNNSSSSSSSSSSSTELERLRSWITEQRKEVLAGKGEALASQIDKIEEYCIAREKNIKKSINYAHCLFVLPTGYGKSYIMIKLAELSDGKTLIIVPQLNLIDQLKKSIKRFSPNVKLVCISSEEKEIRRMSYDELFEKNKIIITTYQTFSLHHALFPLDLLHTVCYDEAHRAAAPKQIKVVRQICSRSKQEIQMYSATPECDDVSITKKTDPVNLYHELGYKKDGSDNPVKPITICEGIDQERLAPLVFGLAILEKTKADSIHLVKQKTEKAYASKLNQEAYINKVIDLYLNGYSPVDNQILRGKRAIILCGDVSHTKKTAAKLNTISVDKFDPSGRLRRQYEKNLADKFYAKYIKKISTKLLKGSSNYHAACGKAKISAENDAKKEVLKSPFQVAVPLFSPTQKHKDEFIKRHKDCSEILRKSKLGGIGVLVGCDKLTEGYDDPTIEVGIMNRISKSNALITQGLGRVLRKLANKIAHLIQVVTTDTNGDFANFSIKHLRNKEGVVSYKYPASSVSSSSSSSVPSQAFERHHLEGAMAQGGIDWEAKQSNKISLIKSSRKRSSASLSTLEVSSRKKHRHAQKPIKTAIDDLKVLLQELESVFNNVKNIEIVVEENIQESTDNNTQDKMELSTTSTEKKEEKSEAANGTVIITRQMKSFLENAEGKLNKIDDFLEPFYQACRSSSSSSSSAAGNESLKTLTTEERIAYITQQAQSMVNNILKLQNASLASVFFQPQSQGIEGLKETLKTLISTISQNEKTISEKMKSNKEIDVQRPAALDVGKKVKVKRSALTAGDVSIFRGREAVAVIDPENKMTKFQVIQEMINRKERHDYSNIIEYFYAQDDKLFQEVSAEGDTLLHLLVANYINLGNYYGAEFIFTRIKPSELSIKNANQKTAIEATFDRCKKYRDWDGLFCFFSECYRYKNTIRMKDLLDYAKNSNQNNDDCSHDESDESDDESYFCTSLENCIGYLQALIDGNWEHSRDFFFQMNRLPRMAYKFLTSHPAFRVNDTNKEGDTTLHISCRDGCSVHGLKFILKKKPDLAILNLNGQTAFHELLDGLEVKLAPGHIKLSKRIKYLVKYDQNIFALKNKSGVTAAEIFWHGYIKSYYSGSPLNSVAMMLAKKDNGFLLRKFFEIKSSPLRYDSWDVFCSKFKEFLGETPQFSSDQKSEEIKLAQLWREAKPQVEPRQLDNNRSALGKVESEVEHQQFNNNLLSVMEDFSDNYNIGNIQYSSNYNANNDDKDLDLNDDNSSNNDYYHNYLNNNNHNNNNSSSNYNHSNAHDDNENEMANDSEDSDNNNSSSSYIQRSASDDINDDSENSDSSLTSDSDDDNDNDNDEEVESTSESENYSDTSGDGISSDEDDIVEQQENDESVTDVQPMNVSSNRNSFFSSAASSTEVEPEQQLRNDAMRLDS